MASCSGASISLLVYTSVVGLSICGDRDKLAVQYRVLEEQPANTTIGHLAADVKLFSVYSEDELASLRYNLITVDWNHSPLSNSDHQPSCFTLNVDSGLLTTSKVMLFVQTYNISRNSNTALTDFTFAYRPINLFYK